MSVPLKRPERPIFDRLVSDPAFRDQLQKDPFGTVEGYEIAPTERSQLLDKAAHMNRPRSPAHDVISKMVADRRYGGDEWQFRDMSPAELLFLAWAAGDQAHVRSAVHPRLQDVLAEAQAGGEPVKAAVSRLSDAAWQEILDAQRRGETFPGYRPPAEPDDDSLHRWRATERYWAQSLLSELEARRTAVSKETLVDLDDACAAVRRFIRCFE